MRAGDLRHRIELLKPAPPAANEFNELKPPEYAPDGSLWAQVEELSGAELVRAQQIQADITTQVIIDGHGVGSIAPGELVRLRLGDQRSLLATMPEATFFSRYAAAFGR